MRKCNHGQSTWANIKVASLRIRSILVYGSTWSCVNQFINFEDSGQVLLVFFFFLISFHLPPPSPCPFLSFFFKPLFLQLHNHENWHRSLSCIAGTVADSQTISYMVSPRLNTNIPIANHTDLAQNMMLYYKAL